MNTQLNGWMAAALVFVLMSAPTQAGTTNAKFDFDASAGYRYDSNVNIAEIDASTGEGDNALVLDVGIDGTLPIGRRLSLSLGYGYTDTAYRNFSEFDLGMHHLRGELGYRIAGFETAMSVDRFAASLDSEGFLDITRVSPSVSRLFGNRIYLRGAYAESDKSYDELAERNAINDALRADAYFLIDGMQRYLALTLERDTEDALANEFDYDGMRTGIAYGHRIETAFAPLDLKAHLQFDNRHYAFVGDDAEAPPRRDERFRAGLSAVMPISEHFDLNGEIAYADNASTLDAARYDEIVYGINVAVGF
jgi:hypothetical protein